MTEIRACSVIVLVTSLAACTGRGEPIRPPAFVDAGTVPIDAATPIDAPSHDARAIDARTIDARPTDAPTTPACEAPVPPFPDAHAPRCSDATRACLVACTDSACMRACVEADETPAHVEAGRAITCDFCLAWQQRRCIDVTGCHAEQSALACCVDEHCPGDGACTSTTCAEPYGAYEACATSTAGACLTAPVGGEYAVCFAE